MKSSIHTTIKHLVLGLGAAVTLACASAPLPVLVARPGPDQQLLYEDGAEKIVSMGAGSIVSIRMGEPMGGRSTFVVGVANQSGAAFVIGPEMVSVSQLSRSVQVYSYEEVKKFEEQEAENARLSQMALGMMGGLAPMGGVAMTPLQTSLQAAQRQMSSAVSAGLSKTAAAHELNLKELSATALKKNTLFPEQMNGGVVYTERIGAGPISIRVQVGGDTHDFQFAL
jgi:hypothetical protein